MKKFVFMGLFAFFLLMQIPLVFSLNSDICDNVSRRYKSDCKEIVNLDLSNNDKLFLIDHLEDSYSVFDAQEYQSPFSNTAPVSIVDNSNYDPRVSLNGKFLIILDLIILFLLSYLFYKILKKCSGRFKWTAE